MLEDGKTQGVDQFIHRFTVHPQAYCRLTFQSARCLQNLSGETLGRQIQMASFLYPIAYIGCMEMRLLNDRPVATPYPASKQSIVKQQSERCRLQDAAKEAKRSYCYLSAIPNPCYRKKAQ